MPLLDASTSAFFRTRKINVFDFVLTEITDPFFLTLLITVPILYFNVAHYMSNMLQTYYFNYYSSLICSTHNIN